MIPGRVPINRDRERTSMLRSGMSGFVPGADIAEVSIRSLSASATSIGGASRQLSKGRKREQA
jgi:hypothetical protein